MKTERLNLRLNKELDARIKEVAARDMRPMTQIVELCLEAALPDFEHNLGIVTHHKPRLPKRN